MPNILFVCSANRFRSVIAAGCLKSLIQEQKTPGDWKILSAGIWAEVGAPPLKEAIEFARARGFDVEPNRSREINPQLVKFADLIIVMTSGQKEAIVNEFPESAGKLTLLSEICSGQYFDIPDPVISTEEAPGEVAAEICDLVKIGLPKILAKAKSSALERVGGQPTIEPIDVDTTPTGATKKKRRWWIWLLLLAVLAAAGYYVWTNPIFGKRLPQFSGEIIQSFTPLPAVQTAQSGTATADPLQVPLIEPVIKDQKTRVKRSEAVCGQTEPMFILALGIDEVRQADVIRLVRVDFVEKKVLVLSIPRDLWVPIPGLADYNITEFKINAAFGYGEYFYGAGQGPIKFSETVYYNYGINFDRYGAVDFTVFEQLIDAVGGVDFYLDAPIGAYGYQGNHHMDGATALSFARYRQKDSDDYRIMRQSVIINAFLDKIKNPEYLPKLPVLGARMIKDRRVTTDFTLRDIYTFICFVQELNEDSVTFKDLPGDLYTPMITNYGRYIRLPKPEATTYIQDLIINGNY